MADLLLQQLLRLMQLPAIDVFALLLSLFVVPLVQRACVLLLVLHELHLFLLFGVVAVGLFALSGDAVAAFVVHVVWHSPCALVVLLLVLVHLRSCFSSFARLET